MRRCPRWTWGLEGMRGGWGKGHDGVVFMVYDRAYDGGVWWIALVYNVSIRMNFFVRLSRLCEAGASLPSNPPACFSRASRYESVPRCRGIMFGSSRRAGLRQSNWRNTTDRNMAATHPLPHRVYAPLPILYTGNSWPATATFIHLPPSPKSRQTRPHKDHPLTSSSPPPPSS